MKRSILHAGFVTVGAGLVVAACSSAGPSAQAYANVVITQGGNSGTCGSYPTDTTVLAVGSGGSSPTDVSSGAKGDSVSCTVSSAGNGNYNIRLDVGQGGANPSEFTVTGVVNDSNPQPLSADISVSSSAGVSLGAYGSTSCTFTPTAPTASTRIWGHLQCLQAVNSVGGGATCEVDADFQFEYCGS